ncbi:MAG: hypothetical protein RL358_1682 [Pseudomonadota bacterium]|jgi:hypothetical protein
MAMKKFSVKYSANFEHNLATLYEFLSLANAAFAYDQLLDELADSVIPNLENFPAIGRSFLARPVGSVEVSNALGKLKNKLAGSELREYLFGDYLVLYAQNNVQIYLLAIKHHRQLSFDFPALWAIH